MVVLPVTVLTEIVVWPLESNLILPLSTVATLLSVLSQINFSGY